MQSGGEVEVWLVAAGAFARMVLKSARAADGQKKGQAPSTELQHDLSAQQLLAVLVYQKVGVPCQQWSSNWCQASSTPGCVLLLLQPPAHDAGRCSPLPCIMQPSRHVGTSVVPA